MQSLSAAQLLELWERGHAAAPVERALLLLSAACPESDREAIARLPIGRRDERLLTLREWAFGPGLTGLVACPECGQCVEASFNTTDIRAAPPDEVGALTLTDMEHEVQFRLPDSLDLLAIPAGLDVDSARGLLLDRCVVAARRRGESVPVAELPAAVVAAVASHMAAADPQANVQLELRCPACAALWQAAFDVVSFFWAEIDAWAQRTLTEVHALARAYGWREADVLSLSPRRRRMYLDMVSG
jgi:hypothetical protein